MGNLGYDVEHYNIQLSTRLISFHQGVTTIIDAVTTQSGLSQLSFDFIGFEDEIVTVNGTPVTSFRDGDKLIVNLPETVLADTELRIAIAYEGQPVTSRRFTLPFAESIGMTFREGSIFCPVRAGWVALLVSQQRHAPRDESNFHVRRDRADRSVGSG